ncbi:MAG: acyl-CoA dehydrogenase family protein [Phycisphaerae bacterium]|nr:acyl-CoA dehydrogenase family protein [Phycisphaerae bacterium]
MDFTLDEDLRLLQQMVRDFARKEVAAGAGERNSLHQFPTKIIGQMAELGLMGATISEQYGGSGLGSLASCLIVEELSHADASVGVILSAHLSLCIELIQKFGTDAQKQKYLPRAAAGQCLGAYSLSEAGAGSDPASLACRAELVGDEWVINGTKMWVTNGNEADVVAVFVVTEPATERNRISALLVDKGTPGFRIAKLEKKLGIRSTSTAEYVFEDCRVPKDALLGERGRGLRVALTGLDSGRLGIASQAIGIAQASLDAAVAYAKQRKQFGKPIGEFEAIQWMLADSATEIEAARLLTHKGAWLKDQGQEFSTLSAMAKLYASEAASRAANRAVQIHGGSGYTEDFPVERYLRDAKITEIYEGTSEIQRLVIARHALRD